MAATIRRSPPTSSPRSGRTSACARVRRPRSCSSPWNAAARRHSFVGRGSRIVGFDEAEALGEPVVGYLGYDVVARLEPTVPLPGEGPGSREPFRGAGGARPLRPRTRRRRGARRRPGRGGAPARRAAAGAPARRRHAWRSFGASRIATSTSARVERAKEHIREGDVFQVVIAQRAERPTSRSAFELYRALRRVNPSPYLFLLELGEIALVGSSPETVVKCEGRALR